MSRRRALLVVLGSVLCGNRVDAQSGPDLLVEMRDRLADAALLRGEFRQSRQLAGFRRPLISSGEFVQVRGRGVLWVTRKPFASTMIVTPERLETRDAQGRRTGALNARQEPVLRSINALLLAAMSADLSALRDQFRIQAELVGSSGWRLQLTATETPLARQIARITVAGERQVREVSIEEVNGDQTEIRFSGWQTGAALTAAEDALLSGRAP